MSSGEHACGELYGWRKEHSSRGFRLPGSVSRWQLSVTFSGQSACMTVTATSVEQPVAPASGRGRLLQVLGVAFGIAVIIGNTIGSGILRTPGTVASLLPSRTMFLLAWIAGGVYALLGVISLAELGVIVPRSGGQYVFAQRAFGPYAGFIIGWSDWISSVASFAAAAILIGEYTASLVPAVSSHALAIGVAVVVVFTVLQYNGVKWGDRVQQSTTVLKALAYVGLVVACFAFVPSAAPTEAVVSPTAVVGFGAVVLAMQAVIFTYDGWNGLLYFSEEVRIREDRFRARCSAACSPSSRSTCS